MIFNKLKEQGNPYYLVMGILTWIVIAILILSIIGLGWQTFVLGVFKGGEKIINSNPEIKNIAEKAKQYITDGSKNLSEGIIDNTINSTINSNQSFSQSNSRTENDSHPKDLLAYNPV
jgi:hypothetical protein